MWELWITEIKAQERVGCPQRQRHRHEGELGNVSEKCSETIREKVTGIMLTKPDRSRYRQWWRIFPDSSFVGHAWAFTCTHARATDFFLGFFLPLSASSCGDIYSPAYLQLPRYNPPCTGLCHHEAHSCSHRLAQPLLLWQLRCMHSIPIKFVWLWERHAVHVSLHQE